MCSRDKHAPPTPEPGCSDALCRVHMAGQAEHWEHERHSACLENNQERRKGLSTYGRRAAQAGVRRGVWPRHQLGRAPARTKSQVCDLFVTTVGVSSLDKIWDEMKSTVSFSLKGPTPDSALW